jgi:hypothetical protein
MHPDNLSASLWQLLMARQVIFLANNGNQFQDWILQRVDISNLKASRRRLRRSRTILFPIIRAVIGFAVGGRGACAVCKNIFIAKTFCLEFCFLITAHDLMSSYSSQPAAIHIVRHP